MNKEDKELLLKDLCCRIPYKVMITDGINTIPLKPKSVQDGANAYQFLVDSEHLHPYLRPMSSMTNEEKEALLNLLFDKEARIFYIDEEGQIDGKTTDLMKEGINYPSFCPINITMYIDFLNAHHFDYRGLIDKGLALEAPEGMYK